MTLIILIIGAVMIVAAVRNSHGALFTALKTDVPAFTVWAAAILAVGAVGFIPGLKPVSRGLLGLVLMVIILRNYQNILNGFQSAWQGAEAQASAAPSGGSGGSSSGGGFDWSGFIEGVKGGLEPADAPAGSFE